MNLEFKLLRIALCAYAIGCGELAIAKTPAQPNKILNFTFEAPDDGFDMVKTYNYYSGNIAEAIFEPLLKYDYLARPVVLVPNTAQSLPKIEQEGKVYTFKIQPGIYFTEDPAFKGKRRELTAQDYIYSIQRISDPKNHSPTYSFIDGKIQGLASVVAQAKRPESLIMMHRLQGLKL